MLLEAAGDFSITFEIDQTIPGNWIGYGGWLYADNRISYEIKGGPQSGSSGTVTPNAWNKIGYLWRATSSDRVKIQVFLRATSDTRIALHQVASGNVQHKHLEKANPKLLQNMYQFAPEANFFTSESLTTAHISPEPIAVREYTDLLLKSCNRCGRYLPINKLGFERVTLSFSNHCVAENRRPCKHTGFGRLSLPNGEKIQLDYGYQLECRFCKKFEVNTALNHRRTASQMKEDGARRRSLELLIEALYGVTPQLKYRLETGRELTDTVWDNFGGKCFKCGKTLGSRKQMNLDHTRPLKLLWPLDGFATALCKEHNSEKRDRPPVEYYSNEELERLAEITGCSIDDLRNPSPNLEALQLLCTNLDWFFEDFLTSQQMVQERDGKIQGELVVKALQKVIAASGQGKWPDLEQEYERRRSK